MNFELLPTIQIQINSIQAQIQSYLGVCGSELGEQISKQVEKEFNKLSQNIDEEISYHVKTAVDKAITDIVKNYFVYGKGYEFISDKLNKVLEEMNNNVTK